jgi:hypothetical protein
MVPLSFEEIGVAHRARMPIAGIFVQLAKETLGSKIVVGTRSKKHWLKVDQR